MKLKNHKLNVVQWLRNVSTGEVDLGECGMCDPLEKMSGIVTQTTDVLRFLKDSMKRYANENGSSEAFPVPHPTLRPSSAYVAQSQLGRSMNDTSEYGMSRRKLAAWLADELEKSNIN